MFFYCSFCVPINDSARLLMAIKELIRQISKFARLPVVCSSQTPFLSIWKGSAGI